MPNIFRFICVALVFLSVSLFSAEELLEKGDVEKVMQQIMSRHVDHKKMSQDILKKSFRLYIDQFDTDRLYLLEDEVRPYLHMSRGELGELLRLYQRNNLIKYEQLHQLIQKAILRAREIRKEAWQGIAVHEQPQVEVDDDDPSTKRSFARSLQQLKTRIRDDLVLFLDDERDLYGAQTVAKRYEKVFENYDRGMKRKEDEYLFTDPYGKVLTQAESENLVVIHVLKALAKSLDSHTKFLKPSEAFDMRVRLEKGFHGVGIVLQEKDGKKMISRLVKDGPAERTGLLKVNDEILEVDGVQVSEGSLGDLVDKLRDKNESRVTLKVKRTSSSWGGEEEKELKVTLHREMVAMDEGRVDVATEKFGNGMIGMITLHSFYQGKNGITSEKDVRNAIRGLQKQGKLRGVVIDLRDNSGGFLSQAVKVAGLFITNGVVVVSKYSSGEERYYRDMDGKVTFDGPIVVLTSKATASAAEIVAQALQDYGVAIVVGDEQTYGKGTIQSQTFTDNKSTSHFKVTVGKYYTVSGRTPQKEGVKADVVVPSILTHYDIGEEFLESAMGPDKIKPSFTDPLRDIKPGLQPWFMRFYMPTLQERESVWRRMLPKLRNKSTSRISKNEEYQEFLKNGKDEEVFHDEDLRNEIEDHQMAEAVNILKDMITLESRYDQVDRRVAEQ